MQLLRFMTWIKEKKVSMSQELYNEIKQDENMLKKYKKIAQNN